MINTIYTKNFKVECLGEMSIDVYDIEVEHNHNFFANDILVHNSVFISFDKFVEKFIPNKSDEETCAILDKVFDEKFMPLIDKTFVNLANYMNCNSNRLAMSRETIAKTVFWRGARNYGMAILDKEGKKFDPPSLKVAGLECVKSSTPKFIREALKECVRLILLDDIEHVREYEKQFRKKYLELSIEQVSASKSVNDINKYSDKSSVYKKGCPLHVRGALLYNYYVKLKNLNGKYRLIDDGEKIKHVYLKLPNPIRENVISYVGKFPKELGLDKYVDYDTMYEKTFICPLESMLDAVDWKLKHKLDIRTIFGEI